MDPLNEPKASVDARVGDTVAVTLPIYPTQGKWTYRSVDGAIGSAREEMVARWLGPSTPGDKFTFATSKVGPGDHVIAFRNDTMSGMPGQPLLAAVTIHLTN